MQTYNFPYIGHHDMSGKVTNFNLNHATCPEVPSFLSTDTLS